MAGSSPMADFLATMNTNLATIPKPGQTNAQNMPLAYQHVAQQGQKSLEVGMPTIEGQQQPQLEVGMPTVEEQPQRELQVGEPTIESKDKKGRRNVQLPPMTFTLPNGGKVEVPHDHPASKELIEHLKSTVQPQASAAEPQGQQQGFMEQLADALTKRRA